ncbi:hypothetical protein JVT61DRAFT_10978 [Boletus reticuloceps]|uniref:Uncharacterized protein n=1 Tax=Boletus reticuloceps TaxID=495285 RepID=A0A8I3A4Z0_9AGAM|nr:hypothetical protein JVT61DRAFT_10978 [Boletus reticuloceps]
MLTDFCSKLPDDIDSCGVTADLLVDYTFLQEDPDNSSPEEMYHSKFLHALIANPHLSNIAGFIDILGWNVHVAAAGKDGQSVIALVSAVLGHAIKLITEGIIDVDQVLADMASSQDRKLRIKLPKVLNKQTGQALSAPLQFSSANWHRDTMAYKELICKAGECLCVCHICSCIADKVAQGSGKEPNGPTDINPCSLICKK